MMGHGSLVMWVMGQLCYGSHGSWVTKDDPFRSLVGGDEGDRMVKSFPPPEKCACRHYYKMQ